MTIQICSIKWLYQILADGYPGSCAAVISSASEVETDKLAAIPYIFRQYADLDYECPGRSFSQTDAEAFGDFLRNLGPGMDTLYCCCDAGESRSPAVAAAAMRYFGMDDMPVWRNPHFHPNMLVFALLSAALDSGVSDEEQDYRFYVNQKAFHNAIRHTR